MQALDPNIDDTAPTHRLGQYQSWMLDGFENQPIDMIWVSIADSISPTSHRVLPHGEPSIAILRERDACGAISNVQLIICGPSHGSLWYHPEPREELIAVRLCPEWSADVFGICSPEVLADRDNLFGVSKNLKIACDRTLRWAESDYVNPYELAASLFHDLQTFAERSSVTYKSEYGALQLLRATEGRIRTRDIANHLDISERHLRRRVRDLVGCPPKQFARQLRLTAAALAAEKEENPNWAQLAVGCGFHDQAHMINEFQSMLNLTPRDLQKERRALAAFSNS